MNLRLASAFPHQMIEMNVPKRSLSCIFSFYVQ